MHTSITNYTAVGGFLCSTPGPPSNISRVLLYTRMYLRCWRCVWVIVGNFLKVRCEVKKDAEGNLSVLGFGIQRDNSKWTKPLPDPAWVLPAKFYPGFYQCVY